MYHKQPASLLLTFFNIFVFSRIRIRKFPLIYLAMLCSAIFFTLTFENLQNIFCPFARGLKFLYPGLLKVLRSGKASRSLRKVIRYRSSINSIFFPFIFELLPKFLPHWRKLCYLCHDLYQWYIYWIRNYLIEMVGSFCRNFQPYCLTWSIHHSLSISINFHMIIYLGVSTYLSQMVCVAVEFVHLTFLQHPSARFGRSTTTSSESLTLIAPCGNSGLLIFTTIFFSGWPYRSSI